ncbi:MAG: hypothetical protein ACI4SF_10050 [Oscillospiraceae bacterium]
MKKADCARYLKNKPCKDDNAESNMCFFSEIRGRSAAFAAAHPTPDSRSDIACEKILRVMGESFLGRPSLCDEAMETISDFANRNVFAVQEPYKTFLADAAVLFIHKGKARCVLSGNSRVYYLSDGKASDICEAKNYLLFGKKARFKEDIPPEFTLSGKINAFAVVCGTGDIDIDKNQLENSFEGVSNADEWAERLISDHFGDRRLSIMTVILPERKGISAFFSKRKE